MVTLNDYRKPVAQVLPDTPICTVFKARHMVCDFGGGRRGENPFGQDKNQSSQAKPFVLTVKNKKRSNSQSCICHANNIPHIHNSKVLSYSKEFLTFHGMVSQGYLSRSGVYWSAGGVRKQCRVHGGKECEE